MNIAGHYELIHERFSAALTREDAFTAANVCAGQLGFPYLIYAPVRNHPDASRNWSATTYPESWQQIYIQKNYLARNPTRHKALVAQNPFTWSELEHSLPRLDTAVFHDCRAAGMRDGLVVPVHGPLGLTVAIGFACEQADAINPNTTPMLQLIAWRLHHAFDEPASAGCVRLTPREIELLLLMADGLGNDQIATKLTISDNSVEWHLKNIFRKLEVSNRTGAVVKALKQGLLPF